MGTFTTNEADFVLDGRPLRVLAGAMHYFRVHPHYWADRLGKLRLMGLNTLETYVAWNVHEPRPGEFVFDGWADLVRYIECAAEEGLHVIVRPGPYICSEWDLGGLPAWLLADPGMRLRCNHQPYLDAVDRYFDQLIPRLAELQITRGGPIIAVQVENEYGSYGNDKTYLKHIEDGLRARGVDTLLFTSDGPTDEMLQYGTLPGVHKTANFGSWAKTAFPKLREYQPDGPLMCAEYWNGWFDHWGEEHHLRTPEDAAAALDEILAPGGSVSFYMFHGGTNFGFMSGANHRGLYQPDVTSYDYDAPLNEQGDVTPKFLAFRDVIAQYTDVPDGPTPDPVPTMALGPVQLTESAPLRRSLDVLSEPVRRATPDPMEYLGQSHGFIHYRTAVTGPRAEAQLTIREAHDRAHVFQDGKLAGVVERTKPDAEPLTLTIPQEGSVIEILVENMGRVNYGPQLHDRKGITDCVMLGQQILFGWTIHALPLHNLGALDFGPVDDFEPATFYRGAFDVPAPADTFLALDGWTKGVAWINGFNLGRYWSIGPQRTLYVPAPLLRAGRNELIVLELDGVDEPVVEFRAEPELG